MCKNKMLNFTVFDILKIKRVLIFCYYCLVITIICIYYSRQMFLSKIEFLFIKFFYQKILFSLLK